MLLSCGLDFQWTRSFSEVGNYSWRGWWALVSQKSSPFPCQAIVFVLLCSALYLQHLQQAYLLPWKLMAGMGGEAAVALVESFSETGIFQTVEVNMYRFTKKKKKKKNPSMSFSSFYASWTRSLTTFVEQTFHWGPEILGESIWFQQRYAHVIALLNWIMAGPTQSSNKGL